uniref:Uncharacterized protein n=1 Tax=Fusarium oxysporum (strain Fo5176) TaxID=660025 RepID=A0A0D2Y6F0_FUSOF
MYLMPDNQSNARWLDERQKTIAIERVRENQTVTKDRVIRCHQPLLASHSMSFTLSAGLMASNYAGNTKKSTASGIIFAGWAAGLIAGPQREAPTYDLAFKMLMGCYALMVVLPILQLIWYKYENARRDKLCDESVANTRPEFTDETDFEKWRTFRYTM